MPAFSGQLSEQEIANVAAYVSSRAQLSLLRPSSPQTSRSLACDLDRTLICGGRRPAAAHAGGDRQAPASRASA